MNVNAASKTNGMQYLTTVMGVALITMNLLLIHQNKELKASARIHDQARELKPGTQVPELAGTDLDGNRLVFGYGQTARKTLLLVMSPGCKACAPRPTRPRRRQQTPRWGRWPDAI